MKKVFYSIVAISIGCFSSNFVAIGEAQAIEEGLYWGGGSRYIRIAKQASSMGNSDSDRVCYHGFSPNGSVITSLKLEIPRYQTGIDYEVYRLQAPKTNNLANLAIQQNTASPDKITFGKLVGRFVREGSEYKRDGYSASDGTPELQECLDSTKPYFKQILSGRDRR
ncbi:MAG: hypothetical protein DCF19_18500 [Pseudanabaena frigida]|uniref:Uncharacterized protein n=1 Tax=Pseudanabaena frigida TaxID=945775 RepID=A0A2W4VXS1_9CYAN|nr:MAG: hypothetical protein DCF19_18500 [Pseudanabaena frigida]